MCWNVYAWVYFSPAFKAQGKKKKKKVGETNHNTHAYYILPKLLTKLFPGCIQIQTLEACLSDRKATPITGQFYLLALWN